MNKLLVISNHNPQSWSAEQKEGWDEILYVPFPNVDPHLDTEGVYEIASNLIFDNFSDISEAGNISIQGEMSLTYNLISFIKKNPLLSHIRVWIPTTERVSVEKVENGQTIKTAVFRFVRWREV
jgi:hypothetical protein